MASTDEECQVQNSVNTVEESDSKKAKEAISKKEKLPEEETSPGKKTRRQKRKSGSNPKPCPNNSVSEEEKVKSSDSKTVCESKKGKKKTVTVESMASEEISDITENEANTSSKSSLKGDHQDTKSLVDDEKMDVDSGTDVVELEKSDEKEVDDSNEVEKIEMNSKDGAKKSSNSNLNAEVEEISMDIDDKDADISKEVKNKEKHDTSEEKKSSKEDKSTKDVELDEGKALSEGPEHKTTNDEKETANHDNSEISEVKNDQSSDKVSSKDADAEETSTDKTGHKEKSLGIDAIAQKLGQQMKVNSESAKEPAEEEETKEDGDTKKDGDKTKTVNSDVASEDKTSGRSTPDKRSKGEEKKSKSKKNKACAECGATKKLKYQVPCKGKVYHVCSADCFKSFKGKQQVSKKEEPSPKPETVVEEKSEPAAPDRCNVCKKELKDGKGYYSMVGDIKPLCSESCLLNYRESNVPKKKCSECKKEIEDEVTALTWETMDFCNEDCLGKYQSFLGSHCTCCQSPVQQTSLGKYCVCFGSDIRQFCSGTCLEEFKKGLKVCSFCQKDLSSGSDGFLAPVGDKGMFKDFCSQQCMERYEVMNTKEASPAQSQQCAFCKKPGIYKIKPKYKEQNPVLCSDNCVAGYRYVNKIIMKICETCYRFFDPDPDKEFSLQYEGVNRFYCTKACMTLFVLSHRKIVPCSFCHVKKYNFDMIEKLDSSHQMQTYCSLNCISLFRVSLSAMSAKSIRCDQCNKNLPAQFHLTMSDGSIRNFCTFNCVTQYQNQFTNTLTLTTTTTSNRQSTTSAAAVAASSTKVTTATHTPVISNVVSLAAATQRPPATQVVTKAAIPQKVVVTRQAAPALTIITTKAQTPTQNATTAAAPASGVMTTSTFPPGTQIIREVIVKPAPPKSVKNKAILCKPVMVTKGISCKPLPCHKAVQTDEHPLPTIVPIPVPIFVPTPVHMFSRPVPCPVPFPVPIPVPIFVPTTKDSPTQIIKHLKDIQEKIPTNPFEAELLMMAEMVAENDDKKDGESNSDSAFDGGVNLDLSNIADDDDQLAMQDAPLDVETAMPPGIAPVLPKEPCDFEDDDDEEYFPKETTKSHGKRTAGRGRTHSKRARVEVLMPEEPESFPAMPLLEDHNASTLQSDTQDTNLRLKYAFGVNAWKHWVLQKNNEITKGSQPSRKLKLFKTDLLQLPPDELNYSLCLFVKEVRKPNGDEYAPASIHYLCLGIQQYLFENGRIDNIFTDPYYEKFTECLNDVLLNQEDMISIEGYFISRIEEEVLWESKQLGAHSPHVLLNTLMFFNTKYFNLKTIDEHSHLSFSHITKHWSKTSIKSGPRNVVLRYYPPATKEWKLSHKQDNAVYEQYENLENPLRCPVKLYEFYLSKCPESVKARNDVFYLYPERSCVPDSPVWYSTQPMSRDMISKMLQRIKTVREIYET